MFWVAELFPFGFSRAYSSTRGLNGHLISRTQMKRQAVGAVRVSPMPTPAQTGALVEQGALFLNRVLLSMAFIGMTTKSPKAGPWERLIPTHPSASNSLARLLREEWSQEEV